MPPAIQTVDDLIDLLRRNTDEKGWLQPLLDAADPAAVIEAMAAIFAHASSSADYAFTTGMISQAPGGGPGTTTVVLKRDAPGTAGTIPQGYLFEEDRGLFFIAQTAVPVATATLLVAVPVESLRQTELVDSIDPRDFEISGQSPIVLDTASNTVFLSPPSSTGIASTTFYRVPSSAPISGGTDDYLSEHGYERGQLRQNGEAVGSYRARVRNIPDAVSPRALSQAVQGAAAQIPNFPEVWLMEASDDGATSSITDALKLDSQGGIYTDASATGTADFFGDGGVQRYIDSFRTAVAYFLVQVRGAIRQPNLGMLFYDDGFADDFVWGFPDVQTHPLVNAALMSIWEEANRKRAFGVQFDVEVAAYENLNGAGTCTAPSGAGEFTVFTLNTPTGTGWKHVEGFVSHVSANNPSGGMLDFQNWHRVRWTFTDSTQFTTDAFLGRQEEVFTVPYLADLEFPFDKFIYRIQGLAFSDGITHVNVAGHFKVNQITL